MSQADGPSMAREIADSLARALEPIFAPIAPPAAMVTARGAAQLLGLEGLDRVLAACQIHAGRPWPPEVQPALKRLERLAADGLAAGRFDMFVEADTELAALGAELAALEWSKEPGTGLAVPTLILADAIKDLPLVEQSRERARRVRVTAPVAAALRAAIDWLSEEAGPPQPLRITGEESALEIVWSNVNAGGLYPAAKVLAAAGGSIGPALGGGAQGRSERRKNAHAQHDWMVRVPTYAGRNSYLMLMQGDLRIALPWHLALRLFMVAASKIESSLRALDLPVLGPLAPSTRLASDCPVVLVAHGLKRAYLTADRLVWRLEAEPWDTGLNPPAPGLSRAVRTEEGEIYWVVEPERLLEGVEAIIPVGFETKPQRREPPLPILGLESVQPLPEAAATMPVPPPEPQWVSAPEPPRALVVDDSIAARLFLTRLLEQNGYVVRAIGNTTELLSELSDSDWSLICLDVELPEARGEDFLKAVAESPRVRSAGTPVVALVRDDADVATANTAGVVWTLRKPFERRAIEGLLEKLDLPSKNQGGSPA